MHKLLAVPFVLMALTGCAFQGKGVAMGFLYADAVTPVHATENNVGQKKGEACATSILGLVTTGDATIRTAADSAEIREIGAVDQSIKNILGIVQTYCIVVSGE